MIPLRQLLLVVIALFAVVCAACEPTFELPDIAKTTLKDAGYSVDTYQKSPYPERLRFGLLSSDLRYDQVWCVIGILNTTAAKARLLVVQRGLTWRIIYPALLPPGADKYAFRSVDCTI